MGGTLKLWWTNTGLYNIPYFRKYFPPLNSFRTSMYSHQRSQYIRPTSKKNSFRGNYSRKYGIHLFSWKLITGKSFSEALIYFSINPKYSIALLGRFPLIIHQNYISRTLVERQLYTDCFAYLAQMNVQYIHFFLNISRFK